MLLTMLRVLHYHGQTPYSFETRIESFIQSEVTTSQDNGVIVLSDHQWVQPPLPLSKLDSKTT